MNYIILSTFLANSLKSKLCIDCKFFIKNALVNDNLGKCALFPRETYNPKNFLDYGIINMTSPNYYYCSTARDYNTMCGEEGNFFKKKDEDFELV